MNKHKNTKHTAANPSKIESEKKSFTPKDKFHCDQCKYSCQAKSSLEKHAKQSHEDSNKKSHACNVINATKKLLQEKNLKPT